MELRERLAIYRWGQRRPIDALAKRWPDQPIDAIVGGMWRGRGWLAAATPSGLELVRRPWLLGRARDRHFPWGELTAVDTGGSGMSLRLTFSGQEVKLSALGPPAEYARLVDAARERLSGTKPEIATEDVRELARAALGRWRTFEVDAAIVALPEHIEEGETVETVAYAVLDFIGLLVITDRRVLLLGREPRMEAQEWSVHRSWIRDARVVDDALVLDLGVETVRLAMVQPEEQREALAERLRPAVPADVPATVPAEWTTAPPEPPAPWTLTAAEAYLLRYLEEGAGVEHPVFRLALLELVARDALRIEPVWVRRRMLPGWRVEWVVAAGPRLGFVDIPALAPLVAGFERARAGKVVDGRAYRDKGRAVTGVPIDALGEDLALTAACVESLHAAGLANKPLGRTADGEAADDALGEWLTCAPRALAGHDVDRARRYLHGAGAAVLLATDALPALSALAERLPREPWLDGRLAAAQGLDTAAAAIDDAFRVIEPGPFG